MGEPLDHGTAKRRVRTILSSGTVSYSIPHALEEMEKDNLTRVDVVNVMRGGTVNVSDWVHGHWRYRVETQRICVVIVFRGENELRVITAWRKKS